MIEIGKYNTLNVVKETPQGFYLGDHEGNEILIPNAFAPGNLAVDDTLEVFVYLDSEERPIATTRKPLAVRDSFATLEVGGVTPFGAFFKWGVSEELLVPKALQEEPIENGDKHHVVYIMLDEVTNRLIGTTYIGRYLDNSDLGELKPGDEVDLIAFERTDLGIKVIINQKHEGLLFHGDLFRPLKYGDHCKGYIKKIRPDQKIDVVLEKFGYRKVEPGTEKILEALRDNNGFLPLNDKTDPELIKNTLHISKKVFKKAVGALYKQRLIRIENDGIYLSRKK